MFADVSSARGRLTRRWTALVRCVALILLFSQAPTALYAQALLTEDIRGSHVTANVPGAPEFAALLTRDLLAHFKEQHSTASSVEYRLLRDAPTQSGVAYPKFYAWVRVMSSESCLISGAVRVAAIERNRFEVTDFVPSSAVRSDRGNLEQAFPAALVGSIVESEQQDACR